MRSLFINSIAPIAISALLLAIAPTASVAGDAGASVQRSYTSKTDGMASTVQGYIGLKDYERAEKAALELTTQSPEYGRGWLLLGYCQTKTGKFGDANAAFDKALAYGEDRNSVLVRKAYNHIQLKEFDEARVVYKLLLENDPNNIAALKKLGVLESKLHNYDAADICYRRILDGNPDDADAVKALAELEAKRGGGTGEAKRLLQKTLELDPNDVDALGKLGTILIREKNYTDAIAPLQKLIELDADNVKAHHNLGVAYFKTDDKNMARVEFEKVRELGGELAGLYGPLADAHMHAGAVDQALVVIREGIEKGEQSAWLHSLWGNILEKRGDHEAAIAKFSKAVALQEAPWSGYAQRQIARQEQLLHRAALMRSQGMK